MKTNTIQTIKKATMRFAALLAAVAAPSAFAASQTWSNAPSNALWIGSSNWIANAVPGGLNLTGNTVNNDTATFNSPLAGGTIGGAANPILTDDATTTSRSRQIGSIIFDTANVGAYVISNATMLTPTSSNGVLYVSHNGSIQMNAAVTNSQTILVPLVSRSPSSTDVVFNFINNAVSSSAILYINSASNNMGTSRGTRWQLGGTNTGNNTIASLSRGNQTAIASANGIRKQGPGTWVLTGQNDFLGSGAGTQIAINEGMLVAQHNGVFGATPNVTVTSNAVLRLDGVTLDQLTVNAALSGTYRMNGSGTLNGLVVGNAVGTSPTLATTSASDVFTVGSGLVANSIISGGAADSVLNTTGLGSLVFAQANTYIGKWNFAAATNQINNSSALGTGANANVAAGAIFDFSVQGAVPFVPTTAGFGGSGTGSTVGTTAAVVVGDAGATLDLSSKAINLTFTPTAFSGDTTHPALTMAQGTLAIGGNTFFINNASGTPLGVGTYRLIEQTSGSITSGGGYAALISGSGMVVSGAAAIVVSGGNVDLIISIYTPKNLVWSGAGPDWDINTTLNWLDGITPSVFNSSDNATFNGTGIANPNVNLVGTLAPATAVVDTSAGDYTFGGVGQVAGTTGLTKNGAGTLNLNTVNTYAGGTVVSNGTVKIGANNAISGTGAGDVAVYGAGVIDLNGFNNTINALIGNGSVDNASGGASILTVGSTDHSGTFSGLVKNTSGTLGITKLGTGTITLSGANTYVGATVVSAGTLEVQNANALGSGASTVAINGGNLRTTTSINVNTLTGADGTTIANSAGSGANIITHTGVGNYTGVISDGASGSLGIYIPSGTLRLNGNNTYSGGTIVASGATLEIGVRNPGGSGNAGAGGITASNTAIVSMPTSVSTSAQVPNNVTNVDANGTLYFTSPSTATANQFNGQFIGGANNTNIYSGGMSIGGTMSWEQFLGTVVISNGAGVRFNSGGAALQSGGDNTLFVVNGNLFNRDAKVARLGALVGSGSLGGPTTGPATFLIGAKNQTTTFPGIINGNNNIGKVGTGGLTLNGVRYWTNTVTLADPFEPTNIVSFTLYSNAIAYVGTTTVSNGTLTVVAPNNLTNSPNITLAGGTLDATQIGYSTNQTTLDFNSVEQATNTVVVTSGVVEILAGQSLNGQGSLLGSVTTTPTSTVNVGNPVGTMAISGSIALNGTVNMDLNRTNSPNNGDRLTAGSFSGSGATLNVTDAGPALFTGTICQLFSGPVTAFATVNLPASNGATTYVWTNKITINGTIELLSGASPVDPNPTNITATVTGGGTTLTLDWPSSHTGWTLQAQTNSVNVGITATWFDVAGSATNNQVVVPIVPGNPTVFYRLKL